jgi:hypothetical protein
MHIVLRMHSHTWPCGQLNWAVTSRNRSLCSCLVMENFMWIEHLLKGHQSFRFPKGDMSTTWLTLRMELKCKRYGVTSAHTSNILYYQDRRPIRKRVLCNVSMLWTWFNFINYKLCALRRVSDVGLGSIICWKCEHSLRHSAYISAPFEEHAYFTI